MIINDEMGLFGKYIITKADGNPIDKDADYFVLRIDKDEHARKAILNYADNIFNINPLLAQELRERIANYTK